MTTISAEISLVVGGANYLNPDGPVDAIAQLWEGPHGIIGIGYGVVNEAEGFLGTAATKVLGREVRGDLAE